jgi:hypothetical protein
MDISAHVLRTTQHGTITRLGWQGNEKARRIDDRRASDVVEVRRLELLTPYMRSKCSTS